MFSNKRRGVVYDFILMIIDRYIKMIKYVSIIKKIDAAELTKMFFEKIVLRFNMSDEIVNDRKFVFTNVFWFAICYHARIQRRLNIAFHLQTNEQIERQNQMLEHYLKCFVNEKQINWTNLLSLAEFVSNNSLHNFASATSFYLMYEYHSKIRYEVENNFFKEEISSTKDRVEQLQNLRKNFEKQLKKVAEYQMKYYNKNHKSRKFVVGELILLSIKNLNQKRSSKKMFFKFAKSFKIENKIEK